MLLPVAQAVPLVRTSDPSAHQRELVADAVGVAGWPGIVLPRTRVLGVAVYPVVEFSGALRARVAQGWGPEFDIATLAMWESWPAEFLNRPPPAPLRVVGVVVALSLRRALTAARLLAGVGATMVVTPRAPSVWQLTQADISGVWVAKQSPDGEPAVLVAGRTGPVSTARRIVEMRQLEEQLFAHAAASGLTTCPLLSV